jgi:hypothetical protein
MLNVVFIFFIYFLFNDHSIFAIWSLELSLIFNNTQHAPHSVQPFSFFLAARPFPLSFAALKQACKVRWGLATYLFSFRAEGDLRFKITNKK